MSANPQHLPTAVVRELMRRYAADWARRATRGTPPGQQDPDLPPQVVYVDPFAGADYPAPAPRGGVPVDVAAHLRDRWDGRGVRAVLLEEDPAKVQWLQSALDAIGFAPGGAVLREDDGSALGELVQTASAARDVLLLLDPLAAGRLPMDRLAAWLPLPQAEVLIRFPVADLRRLARYRGSTLADLPPVAKRAVDGISALLGGGRRDWVFPWRSALEEGEAAAEAAVVGAYVGRLSERAGRLVRHLVVSVDDSLPPEHLLLVTGDPVRALHLNEVLCDARREGWLPWSDQGDDGVRYVESGSLFLFPGAGARPGARERVVDRTLLANAIAERFAARSLTFDLLLRELLDTELLVSDVRRALADLRRDGRVLFRSLATGGAKIAFPRTGARRGTGAGQPVRPASSGESLSLELEGG